MIDELPDQKDIRLSPKPRPALALIGAARELSLEHYESLVGVSANIAALKEFIGAQAAQHQPVLLIGERGLRQEQIARLLHQASAQWAQPFFAVNCHSLSSDAQHTLLFGPRGVIETCRHGTIYINELTHLSLLMQQRFAAYLEEQRWRARSGRQGGQHLIFTTEWNPAERTAENRLAYGLVELLRSSSFTIKPLRDRSEDIPYLARHLTERITRRLGKGAHEITPAAMHVLAGYEWERNIEELEAVLESAIANTPPQRVDESTLPARLRYVTRAAIPAPGIDLPKLVDDYERTLIEAALKQTNGNQTRASRLLGLRVQTLNMKIKRFAVE
jgi:DNA-binding NtrC family response regulator